MKRAMTIVRDLDGLGPAELAEVARQASARAALLGYNATAVATDPTGCGDERLVYDAAADVLRNYIGDIPAFAAFNHRHIKYKAFCVGVQRMYDLVQTHLQPRSKPERLKAYRYLCGLLVRRRQQLRRSKPDRVRPVDIFSFIDDLNRIDVIVEEQFPDYMPSGLLRILMRRQMATA